VLIGKQLPTFGGVSYLHLQVISSFDLNIYQYRYENLNNFITVRAVCSAWTLMMETTSSSETSATI
jgi:hypothetical protein